MSEQILPCPFCGGAGRFWSPLTATCNTDRCPLKGYGVPVPQWNTRAPVRAGETSATEEFIKAADEVRACLGNGSAMLSGGKKSVEWWTRRNAAGKAYDEARRCMAVKT